MVTMKWANNKSGAMILLIAVTIAAKAIRVSRRTTCHRAPRGSTTRAIDLLFLPVQAPAAWWSSRKAVRKTVF